VSIADRKELVRAFRQKKSTPGIFAVRCLPTGAVWTAASKNLDTQKNVIWFQLRARSHINKTLQAAWNTHGEGAFAFEALEAVLDDNPELIGLLLKEREVDWRAQLAAQKLVG